MQEANQMGTKMVADLAAEDHRAALLFRRHGINYCCGGRWPLQIACESAGLNAALITEELTAARKIITVPAVIMQGWTTDFLMQFIEQVSHPYLISLEQVVSLTREFVEKHRKQYPHFESLIWMLESWYPTVLSTMKEDEASLFPYIRQIANALEEKAPYAAVMVRTLRKPFNTRMQLPHTMLLETIRSVTGDYEPPAKACTSHKVVMMALQELDVQLTQYDYLRNTILYNRVTAMEKELLMLP